MTAEERERRRREQQEESRRRRMEDPAYKQKRLTQERERQRKLREDPDFRDAKKAASRERWQRIREEVNAKDRERYREDPEYRAIVLERNRQRRQTEAHKGWRKKRDAERRAEQLGIKELVPEGSVCALCGNPDGPKRAMLVRDHDHNKPLTESARGVLCTACNTHLGVIETRGAAWLAAAILYLLTWHSQTAVSIAATLAGVLLRPRQGPRVEHPSTQESLWK